MLGVLGFIVFFTIQLLPAIICAVIMKNKGRSSAGGFILGLVTGFFGILIAALWPAYEPVRNITYSQSSTISTSALPAQTMRASCSHCGYKNDAQARFCQHCGTTLTSFEQLEHESVSSSWLKQEERENSAETHNSFSDY